MNWSLIRRVIGGISTGSGGIAIWYAFQRPMCLAGGGGGSCAPNVDYLVPGVLIVLFGLGLIKLRFLAVASGVLAVSTFLYGVFLLVTRGTTLSFGLLIFTIALVFAALAYGTETFRVQHT